MLDTATGANYAQMRQSHKTILIWAILILMFVSIYSMFTDSSSKEKQLDVTDFRSQLLNKDSARNIEAAPELGLHLVGFYDDRPNERVAELPHEVGTRLGDLEQLYAAASSSGAMRAPA